MAKTTPEVVSDGLTIDSRSRVESIRTQKNLHKHIAQTDCIEVFAPEYDGEGKLIGRYWRIVTLKTYQEKYGHLPTRPLTYITAKAEKGGNNGK
jgi:hypothetical protein